MNNIELQITNRKGTYEINGNLTKENISLVKDQFNYLLDHYEEVIMCLKQVQQMDVNAITVLKTLYYKANKRGKVLFVLGKENKKIKEVFKQTQTTYLFRNDY